MTKQERIDQKNARPFLTLHLGEGPLIVTIPKKATKKQIRAILCDAAQMMGVRL